jgi:hypothetical protein
VNPPDVYDADGKPYPERRQRARRVSDDDQPTPEQALGMIAWIARRFTSRLKLSFVVGALSCVSTYVLTAMGAPREVRQLRADIRTNDSARAERTTRIEAAIQSTTERIDRLEKADETKMYLLCVLVKRSDPIALPKDCDDHIQKRGAQ